MFLQLLPVHQNQGVDAALGDEPRRQHCLAKGSGSRQHPGVVGQHGCSRLLLFTAQGAPEFHRQRLAVAALIPNGDLGPQGFQQLHRLLVATARQANVRRMILGAADNARLIVRRQPHRLRLVVFRILKRRQAQQSVAKCWA